MRTRSRIYTLGRTLTAETTAGEQMIDEVSKKLRPVMPHILLSGECPLSTG